MLCALVEQELVVTPFGVSTYYLFIRDSLGCAAYDSIKIVGNGINILLEPEYIICEDETIEIEVENLDPSDQLTYSWTPIEDIIDGAQSNTPTIFPSEPGINVYTVEVSNQFNCQLIASVEIRVIDTSSQLSFVAFQQCADNNNEQDHQFPPVVLMLSMIHLTIAMETL